MVVKLKPISLVKISLGVESNGDAHKFFTNACYKRMDKYVPYSGKKKRYHLRENVTLTTNTITYEMPYAHAQYVGFTTGPVKNYTTPGTRTYWDRKMLSAEKDELTKDVQNYIIRRKK